MHVYGVTIPCSNRFHILGVSCFCRKGERFNELLLEVGAWKAHAPLKSAILAVYAVSGGHLVEVSVGRILSEATSNVGSTSC